MSMLMPHGACLLWKPEWIWLNAISDAMIAGAFFTTAFVLGSYVWRRRRDVMFRGVFWSLAIFAAVCGVTRLLSILPATPERPLGIAYVTDGAVMRASASASRQFGAPVELAIVQVHETLQRRAIHLRGSRGINQSERPIRVFERADGVDVRRREKQDPVDSFLQHVSLSVS